MTGNSQRKEKILIVDDTRDTVELLRKRFRADGYETEEAFDGEEGLQKVHDWKPDLLILDVMMPKLDGYAVCSRLKQDEVFRHMPVLMLTAKSDVRDKIKGLDIGADDYLPKPFDYKELVARVRSLLKKKNASEKFAEKTKSHALENLVDEVSHEVRNPLVAIGGFARRVYKNLSEGDENRHYMEIILQNVEVLEKMVTELVELKVATLVYREPADINGILHTVMSMFATEIDQKNIEINICYMNDSPRILVDRENLTRALFNIVENAIEAMIREPRRLDIATRVNNGFLEVEIGDNGRGFGRETLKNIYDPFFSSKTYGPGLGLTFALRVIQNHKGSISVTSEEGVGSTFTIRLPVTS